ncbi:MAG: GNAT family N-acetyltransferase [Crocinitomicaceae bacterium]|nr:GNAT family N-acetyltransferase [Crocinitomicaceae bacterium]
MEIKTVTAENLGQLELFLRDLGASKESFRYFESRPLAIIRNHLVTFLGWVNDKPVAYGHLDPEDGIVWLGIAVAQSHKGHGYGNLMMQALVEAARTSNIAEIYLTVDHENETAQYLYEKFGFKVEEDRENHKKYKLRIQ